MGWTVARLRGLWIPSSPHWFPTGFNLASHSFALTGVACLGKLAFNVVDRCLLQGVTSVLLWVASCEAPQCATKVLPITPRCCPVASCKA